MEENTLWTHGQADRQTQRGNRRIVCSVNRNLRREERKNKRKRKTNCYVRGALNFFSRTTLFSPCKYWSTVHYRSSVNFIIVNRTKYTRLENKKRNLVVIFDQTTIEVRNNIGKIFSFNRFNFVGRTRLCETSKRHNSSNGNDSSMLLFDRKPVKLRALWIIIVDIHWIRHVSEGNQTVIASYYTVQFQYSTCTMATMDIVGWITSVTSQEPNRFFEKHVSKTRRSYCTLLIVQRDVCTRHSNKIIFDNPLKFFSH